MKIEGYMVIAKSGRSVTARRITKRRPMLAPTEALIRFSLDLPDDAFDVPLVTVAVGKKQVAVALEVADADA